MSASKGEEEERWGGGARGCVAADSGAAAATGGAQERGPRPRDIGGTTDAASGAGAPRSSGRPPGPSAAARPAVTRADAPPRAPAARAAPPAGGWPRRCRPRRRACPPPRDSIPPRGRLGTGARGTRRGDFPPPPPPHPGGAPPPTGRPRRGGAVAARARRGGGARSRLRRPLPPNAGSSAPLHAGAARGAAVGSDPARVTTESLADRWLPRCEPRVNGASSAGIRQHPICSPYMLKHVRCSNRFSSVQSLFGPTLRARPLSPISPSPGQRGGFVKADLEPLEGGVTCALPDSSVGARSTSSSPTLRRPAFVIDSCQTYLAGARCWLASMGVVLARARGMIWRTMLAPPLARRASRPAPPL